MLGQVNPRRDLELLQVLEQLLDQHQLAWGLDAKPENDLDLVQRKDLVGLDRKQLLFRDVLARVLRQALPVANEELPKGSDAFQGCQFGGGTSVYHGFEKRVRRVS